MLWYIPTFYGDFKLTPTAKGKATLLRVTKATAHEKKLLAEFQKTALKNDWIGKEVSLLSKKTTLHAPIHEIADALSKQLKPNRTLISAVKISGGMIEEISKLPVAADAVTVARPISGCPATDFDPAELQARDVLRTFLDPNQLTDFERYNKFVAVGADTGHRYMITSRQARDQIALYQRSFYDLDERRALCAHDWVVPPAEEMLALLVCVATTGNETRLRALKHGQ